MGFESFGLGWGNVEPRGLRTSGMGGGSTGVVRFLCGVELRGEGSEVIGKRNGELFSVCGGRSECGIGECRSGREHRAGDSGRPEQQPEQAWGSVAANQPAAEERGAMGGSGTASGRGSRDSRASTGGSASGVGVEQRGP